MPCCNFCPSEKSYSQFLSVKLILGSAPWVNSAFAATISQPWSAELLSDCTPFMEIFKFDPASIVNSLPPKSIGARPAWSETLSEETEFKWTLKTDPDLAKNAPVEASEVLSFSQTNRELSKRSSEPA